MPIMHMCILATPHGVAVLSLWSVLAAMQHRYASVVKAGFAARSLHGGFEPQIGTNGGQ